MSILLLGLFGIFLFGAPSSRSLSSSIWGAGVVALMLGKFLPVWGGALVFLIAVCILLPLYPFPDVVFSALLLAYMTLYAWKSQKDLKQAMQTDFLTGLRNRKGLEEAFAAEVRKDATKRGSKQVLVICLDCDQFKTFNETFGHRAGDELLVGAAEALRKAAPDGLIGRLGGDEFALAWVRNSIEGLSQEEVRQIATTIQQHLIALNSGQQHSLTWTLGVAGFTSPETVPSGTFSQTPDIKRTAGDWNVAGMMDRADELMLLGKKGNGGEMIIEIDGVRLASSGTLID